MFGDDVAGGMTVEEIKKKTRGGGAHGQHDQAGRRRVVIDRRQLSRDRTLLNRTHRTPARVYTHARIICTAFQSRLGRRTVVVIGRPEIRASAASQDICTVVLVHCNNIE